MRALIALVLMTTSASAHRLVQPRRLELRLAPSHATLVLNEQLDEDRAKAARDRFDRDANGRLDGVELEEAVRWLASRAGAGLELRSGASAAALVVTSSSADEHLAEPERGDDHPSLTVVFEAPLPGAAFDLSLRDAAAPASGTPLEVRARDVRLEAPASGRSVADADGERLIGAVLAAGVPWTVRVVPAGAAMPSRDAARTWFEAGRVQAESRAAIPAWPDRARNVVLVIGDGMGISTVTAARILDGQRKGGAGEENYLSFEQFPHVALVKVYSANQQVPDSAPNMTAIVTGVKTNDGLLAVDERVPRGDFRAVAGHELRTLLEMAEERGMQTGLVTTTRITHATPAACYAHSADRDWESDAMLPADARAAGVKDIARQLVEFPAGDGVDVILGGGRAAFLPKEKPDPEHAGRTGARLDGRDLVEAWKTRRGPGAQWAWQAAQLRALDPAAPGAVLGLFEPSHMHYEADRGTSPEGDPSLTEMAAFAARRLSHAPKGFLLVVEGGRIDHGHHEGSAARALGEAVELSRAVSAILASVDLADTLVFVTADHSHPLSLAGYATRGNPILGLVVGNDASGRPRPPGPEGWTRDLFGLPFAALSYANGPGHAGASDTQPEGAKTWLHQPHRIAAAAKGRADLSLADTAAPSFLQESLVPLTEDTHSGEDVAAYACGAGSRLVGGTLEQNTLFFIMARALGMSPAAP